MKNIWQTNLIPIERMILSCLIHITGLLSVVLFVVLKASVNCGDPGSPTNGQKHGSGHWAGESVSFICNAEYILTGPASRMCLPSGKWSEIQPSCK